MILEPLFLRKPWKILFLLAVALCFVGYGNGCSNGGSDNPPATLPKGQALLGPLSGAEVNVYRYDNLGSSIYTTTTSESEEIAEAGFFNISEDILSNDMLYVIAINGGSDIDADDDGIPDDFTTNNLGTLHLVATGSQLKAGNFKVNILTDIIYKKVSYMLHAKYSQESILGEIVLYARNLLKEDMDGDGNKNMMDILKWDPVLDKDKATKDWSFLTDCIYSIHNNVSYSDELFSIHRNVLGTVNTQNFPDDVAVSGNYAYLAAWFGLEVIDISNPGNPTLAANFDMMNFDIYALTVSGNYVYVAGSSGLQIFDVSNPLELVIAGSVETPGGADDVLVSGNYAYIANYMYGLQVIDVSDPYHPAIVGSVETSGYADKLAVSGNYVFITASNFFQVIDISDPCCPAIVGSVETPDGFYEKVVMVSDKYAYVTYDGYQVAPGLKIVDISDPFTPTIVDSFNTPDSIIDICVYDNDVCILYSNYIQTLDVSNPVSPSVVNFFNTDESAYCITVSERYAYVAKGGMTGGGFQVIDVKDPPNFAIIDFVDNPSNIENVVATGDFAYVTVEDEGTASLQMIDISNPADLTVVGGIGISGNPNYLAISDNFAYVSTISSGLLFFDVSDPLDPFFVLSVDTRGGMAISGNYALIAHGDSGLQVLDVSNPNDPISVASLETPDRAIDVATLGNYAYLADRYSGLQVIDIRDPGNPLIIGSVEIPGNTTPANVHNVEVSGDYAYVLVAVEYVEDVDCSLRIIDISDPYNPSVVGEVHTPDYWRYNENNLSLSGNYAYLENYTAGLLVIDVGDCANPIITGTVEIPASKDISVFNGHVYVGGETGLTVYRTISNE